MISSIIVSTFASATYLEVKNHFIEIAEESALPACLAILGPIVHADCLVFAARHTGGELAGAGGVLWQSWGQPAGFPGWVHVLPDSRRRGIGSALARVLQNTIKGEASGLWAAQPLNKDEPAAQFAESVGFRSVQRQFVFETDALVFLQQVERLATVLKARQRIPSGAKIVSLIPELIEPVSGLLLRELSTSPPDIGRMMVASLAADPANAPVDFRRSRVLLVNGEVAGALLSRRQADGHNSTILCNAVAPKFRRGWANVLLLEGTTRAGVEDNCERFQFDCAENNQDTIGLAKRSKARLLRTNALFRYAGTD